MSMPVTAFNHPLEAMASSPGQIWEKQLVEQLKAGQEQAFRQLFDQYFDPLFRHIVRICKSSALAEDVVQETFVKIWENRRELDETLSFRSYLFTIARHQVLKLLQRAAREQEVYQEMVRHADTMHNHTESRIYFQEAKALVTQAIEQLPDQRQLIYRLCREEGLTYDQVATQLGISRGTVNTQMARSLKFIKDYLSLRGSISLLLFFLATLK